MFKARPLHAEQLMAFPRQQSQRVQLGLEVQVTAEEAEMLCAQAEAWAIYWGGRHVACIGIAETFPGSQGVAWAALADGIGGAHLALTRFARMRIANSPLKRIEAVARAADAEAILDAFPGLDGAQLLEAVMAMPTPECSWARLVGLRPAHVLRCFGAAAETHLLFERISA